MPLRIPSRVANRAFTTTARRPTTVPSSFHTYNQPQLISQSVPRLGRIARWYLPTMALIAVGMATLQKVTSSVRYEPARRTVTLDSANSQIGFAIANALEDHNGRFRKAIELSQQEKNRMLLEAYGARDSLDDMARAFEQVGQAEIRDENERNARLLEAYGEKTDIQDLRRAMQIYEVQ